ncbi:MAG: NTP transferase domain-containing protein [Candidatus Omnitrophota bacterium]
MKDLRTIILAAGKGTRMKSETPKVLHGLCGQPMIQYVLDVVKFVGSLKIYIVLGYKPELVRASLPGEIVPVLQKRLLGTADAVRCAKQHFRDYRGDVLVLCGDTPLLDKDVVKRLIRKHKKSKAACSVLTSVVSDPQGYGRIIRGEKGVVIAIREEKDATEFEKNIVEINTGVYCFRSQDLFKAIRAIKMNKKKKEFYLTDIVELFVDQGLRIETVEAGDPSEGLGVNTREDLALAESFLRKKILKKFMAEGVTIVDPETTYIHKNVSIGCDTIIKPFTVIESHVRIGKNCVIGPFARLRPGTKIHDTVEVGNFAEVSRSQIGKKSLMKHFGFLGDAWVGSQVNIGAGVVTANFDGRQKNKTRIEDRAFIGSDSILVAPVKIGKEAMTGAGCVVTRGKVVPDKQVVVGVPGRIIKRRE